MQTMRTNDRRQSNERRQSVERRRPVEGRCCLFELCHSTIRLALVVRSASGDDAQDKVITRSIRWRDQATSIHTDRGEQELTDAFRTLIAEERLAGAKARIALGGEFCVTRVITGQTDEVRREFAELEERTLRYLTLGPGRKALASYVESIDARHQYALLAVASQRTLDLLMRIADAVNLQIEAIEPSLIALSRAQARLREASQEACLLIHVDEDVAEIGICHGGRLLLDYRPGGNTSAENIAEVLARHLSRLQRYLERYHSYLTAPLNQIYLAGDPQAVARARSMFAKFPDFHVNVLEPGELDMQWQHAGETPGTDMAAALGTALALYQRGSETAGPNLIASTLAQLRKPLRPVLIRSSIPFAAVIVISAMLLVLLLIQRREMSGLRAELDELTPIRARANELRLQLLAAQEKLKQLEVLESKLPHLDWQQVLSRISQSMPDDVWLDRVSFVDARSAAITGASYTDGGVYDFVGYLRQVPDIAEIALEGTGVGQTPTGPTTSFTLQLTLADFAGRNDNEARRD